MKEGFIKDYNIVMEIRNSLNDETDRGCVLISASFLDNQLENLLSSYLIEDTTVSDNVFSNSGSLGTFSSRIDMCYLLGLISKKMYRDLHLIRKIRNEFGHSYVPISFESSAIKNRCLELYHNNLALEVAPRAHFIRVVCVIVGIINGTKIGIKHINLKADIEITEEGKETQNKLVKSILDKISLDDIINN